MKKVYSLQKAKEFFLENSKGSIECVRGDGATLVVDCYADAADFFGGHGEGLE